MDMKALLADRAKVYNELRTLNTDVETEDRGLTAEEQKKWDGLVEQLNGFDERIKRARTIEEAERDDEVKRAIEDEDKAIRAKGGDEPAEEIAYRDAFRQWMKFGGASLDTDARGILSGGAAAATAEMRAAGVGTGAGGGYFVPQGFRRTITETQKQIGSVRSVAEVITTDSGQDLPWPTNDDTSNVGAILSENTQVTEQDVTLGQKTLKAYMYTSKLVRVSFQLLQDSAFDVETWLARKLATRIERILNQHFTTGTGSSQPEGIQTNAAVGVTGTTGQTTSVIYDDLVNLVYSIDPAYRRNRPRFMMGDPAIAKVRLIKDSQQRPLWQPSLQEGQPETLLGYGLEANNDMPVMAANAKSILFGDFQSAYVIRDVNGYQLLRLEERYADFLQVGFLGFSRHDALQQDVAAYKAYKNSAT